MPTIVFQNFSTGQVKLKLRKKVKYFSLDVTDAYFFFFIKKKKNVDTGTKRVLVTSWSLSCNLNSAILNLQLLYVM